MLQTLFLIGCLNISIQKRVKIQRSILTPTQINTSIRALLHRFDNANENQLKLETSFQPLRPICNLTLHFEF